MAKTKGTKSKKKRTQRAPEWEKDPAVPERPEHCDLSRDAGARKVQQAVSSFIDENNKRWSSRPKQSKTPLTHEPYLYHSFVGQFARSGEPSPLTFGADQLLTSPYNDVYRLSKKILRFFCGSSLESQKERLRQSQFGRKDKPKTAAVLITNCEMRTNNNKGFSYLWLVNADENVTGRLNDVDCVDEFDFPSISFECLLQFYPENRTVDWLSKRIAEGTVRLLDYKPDEIIPFSAKEKSTKKPKPPQPGFVSIGKGKDRRWHRSGTVLLEDREIAATTVGEGSLKILLGVDDEQYFGVELPKDVSTIEEAFKSLMPEHLHHRSDVARQGEWYLVPVEKEEVPAPEDCVVIFEGDTNWGEEGNAWLPHEPDGNVHYISSSESRVSKDGKVYHLALTLHHEQHGEASVSSGWCVIEKNLAVRSYSQEGVD